MHCKSETYLSGILLEVEKELQHSKENNKNVVDFIILLMTHLQWQSTSGSGCFLTINSWLNISPSDVTQHSRNPILTAEPPGSHVNIQGIPECRFISGKHQQVSYEHTT